MMNKQHQLSVKSWPFIVLYLIVVAITVSGGVIYYRIQKKGIIENSIQNLRTIADLKTRQITEWRRERLSDGTFLSQNVSMMSRMSEFLVGNKDKKLIRELASDLKALCDNYDYKNALLLDKNCNVRLFFPSVDTVIGDYLKDKLPSVIKNGEVTLTDIHQTGKVSFIHLDLLVPVIQPGDSVLRGIIVLRINPAKVLFPLIKSWPVISKTSETIIFHREGDEIVYLNQLRHSKDPDMIMRLPVTNNKLPASMVLEGIQETADGIDYRGVRVIAAMNKVPESPWYLVAKVDRNEAYLPLGRQFRLTVVLVILFILSIGSFLGIVLRNQRIRFYRSKYEAEVERLALVRHYDYILKNANDIIFLFDSNYLIVEANDRALEIYQYTRDELIGMSVKNIRAQEAHRSLGDDLKVLNDAGNSTYETVHIRKDGTTFPIEISARKFEIEGAIFYQSISRDISERKIAEETLKESEERFRSLFEESPVGMVMTGKDMGIIKANKSFCRMIGYSEEELCGMTFRNFTHPDNIGPDEVGVLLLVAKKIPVYRTEKRYIRKDGSTIWGSSTIVIIRNKKDEVQLFFAMVEDITARKIAEEQIIAAKEKAEESDRLKTAFLHNVSHEIRTPMNAILGFSALLNEPDISTEERAQYTDVIFQSGSQLLSIINDIVDLASIESGQMKVTSALININTTLKRINEQFSYKEKSHNIVLGLQAPLPVKEADVMADSTKLVQVISNLINNAFKFTSEGEINFGYEKKGSFLEFYVKDTGIGIPPEHHSRIFDRFYQVDSAVSRQYGGTGLGLSICKAYVELMGGKIWLESVPKKGTSFFFTIPYVRGVEKQA